MTYECKICNSSDNQTYRVPEMMFGSRDEFTYMQCNRCHCLQLAGEVPNLADYYQASYFSGMQDEHWFIPAWAMTMGGLDITYQEVAQLSKREASQLISQKVVDFYFAPLGIDQGATVLDIGAADGGFLRSLRQAGFTNRLLGIDAFADPMKHPDGVSVQQMTVDELALDSQWDLIVLNHSFEHMPNPLAALGSIAQHLAHNGICLIRIPIVPCYAWHHYQESWFSLDAPRHLFLHSIDSMQHLAAQVGLDLFEFKCDSTAMQFWGSEQYVRDIPFYSPESFTSDPAGSIFSEQQMAAFEQRARILNARGEGDQGAFYFRKG